MGRQLCLAVDFNNFVFSSYYSQKLINSKGVNVNAIKGTFIKLRNLKQSFDPNYLVFASDLSRTRTFRRKLFPEYKAQRKPAEPDIIEQMKVVGQIVALLGFQTINDELYEADDVLGMISRLNEANDIDTIIISSDRDLYQLVTDHVFIMSPRSDDLVDKAYIRDHYNLTPEQFIELKMLQGDPGDNYKGMPGIGPKTALQLMNDYGSIQSIYDHYQELKPSIQHSLDLGKPDLELTRTLVTIITDYNKIGLTMDKIYRLECYPTEIYQILTEYEINSLVDIFEYALLPQTNDKLEVYHKEES